MDLRSILVLILSVLSLSKGQQFGNVPKDAVRWCAVGDYEFKKCQDFSSAVKASGRFSMKLECVKVWSKDECLYKLDSFEADLTVLDPGEVFIGGRYHSLIPIMTEKYGQGADNFYYAIAVVNRTSPIRSAADLKGTRACFAGVGQMAGWVLPIGWLLDNHIMDITDCNNHLKSVANFFGPSCAPNSLIDKNNPTGDNSLHLCERCGTDHETKCLDSDTFAGFGGAFLCMRGNRGDIAFVKHTTPLIMSQYQGLEINTNDYELVCPVGASRVPLGAYQNCNWGKVPSHALVTSSETAPEKIVAFQNFVKLAVHLFGSTQGGFRLFESGGPRYGNNYNLLFSDDTTQVESLEEDKQTFKSYLESVDTPTQTDSLGGRDVGYLENRILRLRQCPVEVVRFCVASDIEMRKCVRMRTAMRAQLLKPGMTCFRGRSQRDCMLAIATSSADLAMFDAGDVFTAGKDFGLIPILAEQYNLDGPYYYAVAVSKIEDPDSDLLYVRGKYTCHTAIGTGAGWIMPVSFLLKNDRLRNWGCDGPRAASEFFQKSCVPGAMSSEYNQGWKQNNLCDLCHGTSSKVCHRDHTEDFYGYTGAYRCLVEGGGHIAFIKHTTVLEISDGNNKMWWARNLLSEDYELLCRDGSRKPITEYMSCNLGQVPGNALVTRPTNETIIGYYVGLFRYAQQFYGSKDSDEQYKFQMFRSEFPYNDVIFQDAAQQLVPIPPEQQNYLDYLGYDFVYAKKAVDCSDAAVNRATFLTILVLICCHSLWQLLGTTL